MAPHLTSRLLAAFTFLALPLAGAAQERSRPPPAERSAPPPAAPSAAPEARPPPPPPDGGTVARPPPPPPDGSGATRPPPPGTRPPPGQPGYPGYYPPAYVPPPYWWGFGWGWSYQPLWGWGWWEPLPPPGAAPPPPADRAVATLFGSAITGGGTGGSFGFASEGHRSGFRVAVDGFTPDRIDGAARLPGTDPLAYGLLTGSWSLVSTESARLRVELGGSMLAMGSAGSSIGKPYAGTTALGVVLGTSGHAGLVGPIGLQAHLRVTPYPVVIVDAGAGLVARLGPVALSGGWRLLDVRGGADEGPDARLSGPELGLTFGF